jgi:hypothetical protein
MPTEPADILPSETPTATIVWFPPTATFTPLPSPTFALTAMPDTSIQHGELIFTENFDDTELWNFGKAADGSIAFGKNELSLGVSRPEGYLYSLRDGASLSDFYLEITANPSICRGKDEYGLLLRVSPNLDFFRFGLNCAGEARLDRFLAGRPSSPQPPVLNGAIPPGAPSSSRLAVWAQGKDLRFYANDEFLFSIRDPSLPSGAIGVYARAAGEDAMTVNFSDLEVYQAQP